MIKSQRLHHSVTENGKLQVRLISEYKDDNDNIINTEYGDPYTPALIVIPEPVVIDPLEPVPVPDTLIEPVIPDPVEDICGYNMYGWDQRSKDIIVAIDASGMALNTPTGTGVEETSNYDMVIEADGKIALRQIIKTFDSGKEISKKFHRSWIIPGDVTDNAFAIAFHTLAVIEQYGILNPPVPVVPPTYDQLKAAINQKYEGLKKAGCPTSLGFKIDCMDNNIADFDQSITLLDLSGAETITVRDYDNVNHVITVAEYKQICLELGAHIMGLRQQRWAEIDALEVV